MRQVLRSGDVAGLTTAGVLAEEAHGAWAAVSGFAPAVAAVKAKCPSSFGSFPAGMVKNAVEGLVKAL